MHQKNLLLQLWGQRVDLRIFKCFQIAASTLFKSLAQTDQENPRASLTQQSFLLYQQLQMELVFQLSFLKYSISAILKWESPWFLLGASWQWYMRKFHSVIIHIHATHTQYATIFITPMLWLKVASITLLGPMFERSGWPTTHDGCKWRTQYRSAFYML